MKVGDRCSMVVTRARGRRTLGGRSAPAEHTAAAATTSGCQTTVAVGRVETSTPAAIALPTRDTCTHVLLVEEPNNEGTADRCTIGHG
jgi:hypothetical protein